VELWYYKQGIPDWFFVSKLPLKDADGRICGTAGVVRRAAEHERQLPIIQNVARAVEIIRRDFAGSVVVHTVGGWLGLAAVLMLGARAGRYGKDGTPMTAHPPSSIPFLALGAWVLAVGWFGFNVRSAQAIEKISGLVATFPFYWFLLALPLAWWRRTREERSGLSTTLLTVAAGTLPVTVLVLSYFSTTMRYETDFAVGFAVLALTGLLALERWAARSPRAKWTVGAGAIAACGATVAVGAMVSFDYHGRSLRTASPVAWAAMKRVTQGALGDLGHALGKIEGPRVLKVRFKARPAGTVETFWAPGDARARERILVEHTGDHLIRFGYEREALPPAEGREHYRDDLVGFEVKNVEGALLGAVDHFVDTPGNAVMVIKGVREHWVPVTKQHLRSVDRDARAIVVDWPEDF
jgi:hypothetical protein